MPKLRTAFKFTRGGQTLGGTSSASTEAKPAKKVTSSSATPKATVTGNKKVSQAPLPPKIKAGSTTAKPTLSIHAPWNCPACTFQNIADAGVCGMFPRPRPV